jgi:hydrogenase maturation factor
MGAPDGAECVITAGEHCISCGDEGISMRVIELRDGSATCADQDGARHQVAVDFVEPVAAGDELLVHAGVAIRHLGGRVSA